MVSVLYRLTDRIPVDFDLFSHENGREAALTHLDHASEGDVIGCDRGYLSFALALAHRERGLHFVLRVRRKAGDALEAFIDPPKTDLAVTLDAPRDETALRGRKLRLRLVKYTAGDTVFRLATSLADTDRYGIQALSDPATGAGESRRCTGPENS